MRTRIPGTASAVGGPFGLVPVRTAGGDAVGDGPAGVEGVEGLETAGGVGFVGAVTGSVTGSAGLVAGVVGGTVDGIAFVMLVVGDVDDAIGTRGTSLGGAGCWAGPPRGGSAPARAAVAVSSTAPANAVPATRAQSPNPGSRRMTYKARNRDR